MIVSILQSNLDAALDAVSRVTGGRTVLPVTACVLLRADADGWLTLTGTNLEQTVVASAGAKVTVEGMALVNARMLAQLVGGLPNDRVDLTLTPKGLEIKCARSALRLAVSNPEDMPPVPTLSAGAEARSLTLDPDVLRDAIRRTAFAAATKDDRPVLTGLSFEAKAGGSALVIATADGFRLNVLTIGLTDVVQDGISAIIPAATMTELSRLLAAAKQTEPVTITMDRNRVAFELHTVTLYGQLIQGTFPTVSQLIPKTRAVRLVLHAPDLLAAVRTAAVFVESTVWLMAVAADTLHVRGASDVTGDGMVALDAVTAPGDEGNLPLSVALKANQLNDALGAVGAGKTAIDWSTPSSPVVLRPVNDDGTIQGNYIQVLMPMFSQELSNAVNDALAALQANVNTPALVTA